MTARERARKAGIETYEAFGTMEQTRRLAADAASDVWEPIVQSLGELIDSFYVADLASSRDARTTADRTIAQARQLIKEALGG